MAALEDAPAVLRRRLETTESLAEETRHSESVLSHIRVGTSKEVFMHFTRLAGAGVALLAMAVVLSGSGEVPKKPTNEKLVKITDKGFAPDRIEVLVGEKVVWQNTTHAEHTVTGKPTGEPGQDLLDSGPIKAGASWEYVSKKEGTYPYACQRVPWMTGTVVVRPAK